MPNTTDYIPRFALMVAAMLIAVLPLSGLMAAEPAPPTPVPEWTPVVQLRAQFLTKPRCPVYRRGEEIKVAMELTGARVYDDILEWHLADYTGKRLDSGTIGVPKGEKPWSGNLTMGDHGAGYFELHLALRKSKITLAPAGTRPGGFLAYGVEPDIEPLALAHPDESRFGAQGTNFIETGRFVTGDPFSPVYPLIGAKWVYLDRRLRSFFAKGLDSFTPKTDPEKLRHSGRYMVKAGLVPLLDLHSVPEWLIDVPEGVTLSGNITSGLQRYPPRDFGVYKRMVAAVAREQVVRRQTVSPSHANNYYQIHWEPDWHWKGTDEQFIGMYKAAFEAIHEHDPDGLLLGPNYGVIRTGNKHLRRLFAKGLGQYLDGILTHTYFLTPGSAGERELQEDLRDLVAMTRKYLKPGARIMNTEWGVRWELPPGEDPDALRKEAGEFLRGHIMTLGEGVDTTFYFYTGDHGARGAGLFYNLTYPHPGCGAFQIAPKPVAMGVMTLSRLLEGTTSLGAIEYLDQNTLGYAFDRAGEKVACFWTTDGSSQTVEFPVGNAETVTFIDPMGNAATLEAEGSVVSFDVSQIPVWLRGFGPPALPLRRAGDNSPAVTGFAGEQLTGIPGAAPDAQYRLFSNGAWVAVGNGESLRFPDNLDEGRLLLGTFSADSGKLRMTHLVDVRAPLNIAGADAPKPGTLVLVLKNEQAIRVKGTLSLLAGEKTFAERQIAIAPGAEKDVTFEVRGFPAGTQPTVRFATRGGSRCTKRLPLLKTLLPAERALTAPEIDGTLDEWRLELFHAGIDPAKRELSEKMAVRMGFQVDDRNLYLAFKINDRRHVQTEAPQGGWRADSIQIGLGVGRDDSEHGWASWQKFTLMKNSVNGRQHCYRDMGNDLPKGLVDADTIRFAINYEGGEALYEIAIPWPQVASALMSPPKERPLGIGVMVNDVNIDERGAKTKRANVDVTGGMTWSKPRDFGLLELR